MCSIMSTVHQNRVNPFSTAFFLNTPRLPRITRPCSKGVTVTVLASREVLALSVTSVPKAVSPSTSPPVPVPDAGIDKCIDVTCPASKVRSQVVNTCSRNAPCTE